MRRAPERSPTIVAGLVFIALLVVVGSVVFLVLDRDPRPRLTPPPATPTLAAIPPSATPTSRPTPTPTPRPTPSPTPRPTASPTPSPTRAPAASRAPESTAGTSMIAGRWNVASGSWAAYRVTIIVPIFGPTDVSGRTDVISGGADIRRAAGGGDEISDGRFIGDLTQLKSGDPAVDRQVAIILQTDRFPTADFVLKGPIPLPPAADRAGGAQVMLPGTITLLGKTNDVLVPATLTERDGRLTVAARYDFDPGDYGVSSDIGGGIATLGDSATFEFSLIVER